MKFNCYLMLFGMLLSACHFHRDGSEEQLAAAADSFAVNYFNYRFARAMTFCTDDSERWLRFAASNVHQADIDILRSQEEPASAEMASVSYENDSTATVRMHVSNYLRMDTIGKEGQMRRRDAYLLKAVLHEGRWKIRMEGLPRSEKRSRD